MDEAILSFRVVFAAHILDLHFPFGYRRRDSEAGRPWLLWSLFSMQSIPSEALMPDTRGRSLPETRLAFPPTVAMRLGSKESRLLQPLSKDCCSQLPRGSTARKTSSYQKSEFSKHGF